MRDLSYVRSDLAWRVQAVLPTDHQGMLLRACLYPRDRARPAWVQWLNHKDMPESRFVGDDGALKSIRPLVAEAVRRHGLDLDEKNQTYLRSAFLREELRNNVFRRVCRELLSALNENGIPFVVLKGVALAETVYESPVLRHCHDIDLLVQEENRALAADVAARVGFNGGSVPLLRDGVLHFRMDHQSGLPLELHCGLFRIPYYRARLADLWASSSTCQIAGCDARILSTSDNLLHVCGHGFYWWGSRSLRWLCDAWLLMEKRPNLDWERFLAKAKQHRLVLPMAVTLGYLAEELGALVPETVLQHLRSRVSRNSWVDCEITKFAVDADWLEKSNLTVKQESWLRMMVFVLNHRITRWLTQSNAYGEVRRTRTRIAILLGVWVPTAKDREVLQLPRLFSLAYYLIRPIRLLRENGVIKLVRDYWKVVRSAHV
jgi:hypothetical protein